MNERLKELYLKAHGTRHYDGDPALDGNPPTVYWQGEASAQRFANLIVRECANLAKTKSDSIVERAMKYAEDADEETSAKATAWQFLVFEQEIKKHFGVEDLKPCKSPYCECDVGKCSHPGFYDARGEE